MLWIRRILSHSAWLVDYCSTTVETCTEDLSSTVLHGREVEQIERVDHLLRQVHHRRAASHRRSALLVPMLFVRHRPSIHLLTRLPVQSDFSSIQSSMSLPLSNSDDADLSLVAERLIHLFSDLFSPSCVPRIELDRTRKAKSARGNRHRDRRSAINEKRIPFLVVIGQFADPRRRIDCLPIPMHSNEDQRRR